MSATTIALIATSGLAAYVALAGLVFALTSKLFDHDDESRMIAAALWPLAATLYAGWWLASFAPRWLKKREDARRIPRAEVRK